MPRYIIVSKVKSLRPGRAKLVFSGDKRIAVFNDRGTFRAVDDRCTHVGASLSEGLCEDGLVTCPWHGGKFRLSDGRGMGPPAYRSLKTYPLRILNEVLQVELNDE